MARSPRPPKIALKRITILLDEATTGRIDAKTPNLRYKGNRTAWIIDAIIEKLDREAGE